VLKNKGGFLAMILSVLGVVLYATMFETVMDAFDDLVIAIGVGSPFIALETVVYIAPTVLLLSGIFGAAWGYWKGYKAVAGGGDTSGMLRMVLGILVIILFVTLFATIVTAFDNLFALYDGSDYIALDTVLTIVPTILFLAGIFAGIGTAVSGYRARRKRGRMALA